MRIGERSALALKACLILSLLCQQLAAGVAPIVHRAPIQTAYESVEETVETCGGCGCCELENGQSTCPCCTEVQEEESCCSEIEKADLEASADVDFVAEESRDPSGVVGTSRSDKAIRSAEPTRNAISLSHSCNCVRDNNPATIPLDSPSRRGERSQAKSVSALPTSVRSPCEILPACCRYSPESLLGHSSSHYAQHTLCVWLL